MRWKMLADSRPACIGNQSFTQRCRHVPCVPEPFCFTAFPRWLLARTKPLWAVRRCLVRRALNCKCCKTRSEEHTSELQSLMRISYAVFCLKKKRHKLTTHHRHKSSLIIIKQPINHTHKQEIHK